jgi:hypothetical protein
MTKKSGGKKGGGGNDDVIEFTPTAGFDIRKAAAEIKALMEELGQSLVIHLARISVEFEVGCTRKEIIDGYNRALRASINAAPANANTTKKKKD